VLASWNASLTELNKVNWIRSSKSSTVQEKFYPVQFSSVPFSGMWTLLHDLLQVIHTCMPMLPRHTAQLYIRYEFYLLKCTHIFLLIKIAVKPGFKVSKNAA